MSQDLSDSAPRGVSNSSGAVAHKIEDLNFDNQTIRVLHLDTSDENVPRQVRAANFSIVKPAPVDNPVLVAVSQDALQLLDLDEREVERDDFVEYFSGNRHIPNSEPAAHCYCGHQFGHFSGQLGDGAAMYLGEVVNERGERWELQFKGAGPTPYSRMADGRKVLRSSIREFLCSEAMHYLGIPTTRAGTIVTSDSRVERDIYYSGNPIMERCTVITRIAPTFLRFGSFEIFKSTDATTGRQGPSAGLEGEMLPVMLNFTIKTYFPDIWERHNGNLNTAPATSSGEVDDTAAKDRARKVQDMYLDFYKEVVRRTARLAAQWMSVGWVHGVLNTDNMSIVGVTLDYGPYGFLDTYNPDFISNGSDDGGRYDYKSQPEICRWNCEKFAEAIASSLPVRRSQAALSEYDEEYSNTYHDIMRRKLGLIKVQEGGDVELVKQLLKTMQTTGADFTNTFRMLSRFPLPTTTRAPPRSEEADTILTFPDGGLLDQLLDSLATPSELAQQYQPKIPQEQLHMLHMLAARDPWLLNALGATPEMLTREMGKIQKMQELKKMSGEEKRAADRKTWSSWLQQYGVRLQTELSHGATQEERVKVMNATNPRFVLRNWIAQAAIELAEKGDYSEVKRVLEVLKDPFSDEPAAPTLVVAPVEAEASEEPVVCPLRLDGKPPEWAAKLCVTCSS